MDFNNSNKEENITWKESNRTEVTCVSCNNLERDHWWICVIVVLIFVCVVFNLCLIIGIIQQKRNSTLSLILQISLNDLLTSWIAGAELWCVGKHDWTFSFRQCSWFMGMEVLTNTVCVYMHVLLNFHAISMWNVKMHGEIGNNPLTSGFDSSNDCLVSQTTPRVLHIDYRRPSTVSVIVPSLLIWFICLSLGIPEWFLASVVDHTTYKTCSIVDLHFSKLLQILLVAFKGLTPVLLMLITFFIVLYKIFNNESLSVVKKNSSSKNFKELISILRIGLFLNLFYILFSFQRIILYILHVSSEFSQHTIVTHFKIFPLEFCILPDHVFIYSSFIHYSSLIFRPIVSICVFPSTITVYKKWCIKIK